MLFYIRSLQSLDPKGKIMKNFEDLYFPQGLGKPTTNPQRIAEHEKFFKNMRGRDFAKFLSGSSSGHNLEGFLKSKGVPGVKYYDAGSRPYYNRLSGSDVTPKKQSRNFVVYDEDAIKLLERKQIDPVLGLLD